MDNEHPVWKTSASGRAKCRSSRLGGGYRMVLSKCIGKRGGCGASLGYSLLKKKKKKKIYNLRPYGDNLFLECHGFLSEMNQCRKHHKQENICRGMCTPLTVGGGGKACHYVLFFMHSSSAVAIPRLAPLPRINPENTNIHHDNGSPRMNYDGILSTSANKTDPDVIKF